MTLLPELVLPPRGFTVLPVPVERGIFAVTRVADRARPSIQALLGAMREAAGRTDGAGRS